MRNTLQEQYNLIKEGKGNKEHFFKSARQVFPDLITPTNSFSDTVTILKNRGIISEGLSNIGGVVTTGKKQDWHAIFNENMDKLKEKKDEEDEDEDTELARRGDEYTQGMEDIHALPNKGNLREAKEKKEEPSKEVLDTQKHNFDYKDTKNYDNVFGEEFLKGYYTEMKDPKNADKDVEELRAIVAKNLAKDISYYVKNGQFGVKGLGYTTEAPGLGTPKEAKGKYKSSGYGDLKESVLRLAIQDLIREALTEVDDKMPPLKKGDKGIYSGEEVEILAVPMHAKKDPKEPQPFSYTIKTKAGKEYEDVPISSVKPIKNVATEVQKDPKAYADEEKFEDNVIAKLKSNNEAKKYFEKHSAEITKKYFDHKKPEGGVSDAVKYILSKAESNPIHEKKKPSAGLTDKEKSAVSKKAHAGKDIGKKGKGFEKIAKAAEKEYGSEEAGKKVAAAAMWKNLAKGKK